MVFISYIRQNHNHVTFIDKCKIWNILEQGFHRLSHEVLTEMRSNAMHGG